MNKIVAGQMIPAGSVTDPAAASNRAELHSLNSGIILHRTSRLHADLAEEARRFSAELTGYMNVAVGERIQTRLYGQEDDGVLQLHWLVHMHNPLDYRLLLDMVDHDQDFQAIYESDRLPERGGGNWEKMFVQGSFRETVLLPQHGFAHHDMDALAAESFVPPARHQMPAFHADCLHSLNAGAVLVREYRSQYATRDLSRYFLSQCQELINRKCGDWVTCAQFEQIWGWQDRLTLLFHLRSPADHEALRAFEASDAEMQALKAAERANLNGTRVHWDGMFESGSPTETLIAPIT